MSDERTTLFTTEIACPICATPLAGVEPEIRGVVDLETSFGRFDIVRCRACDVGVTTPQPLPTTLPSLYGERTTRDYDAPGTWIGRCRMAFVDRRVARAFARRYRRALPTRSVLDVGTGNGRAVNGFAAAFPEARCVATDFSADRPPSLAPRVAYRSYADALEPGERFDVIILRHVLEHVADPVGEIRRLARHLEPNGMLSIEVPDWECRLVRLVGPRLASRFFYAPRHLWHFSRRSLRLLAGTSLPDHAATVDSIPFLTTGPILEDLFRTERKSFGIALASLVLFPLQLAFERATGATSAATLVLRRPARTA